MKRSRAVTLLEMLVVVAIVTLVASLAYPAMVRARESAKIVRSKSNMRQLAILMRQYAEAQTGEGPLGLGLPHSAIAFYGQGVSDDLISTGGSRWQSPESSNAAYNWMMPDVATLPPGQGLDLTLSDWRRHVSVTQESPVLLVDATFPLDEGPFARKRMFGVYFDTRVVTRQYSGRVGQLKQWE